MQNAHRHRGIGRYVGGLARRLAGQTEVPIEFWGWEEDPPFQPPAPHRAIWLPRLRTPRSRAPWLFAKLATRRHLRRSRAEVIHLTDPRSLVLARGRQTLTTVYDLIPLLHPEPHPSWLEHRGYRQYLRTLPKVARIFAISAQTGNDLVTALRIPPARVVLAMPGVDLRPAGDPPEAGPDRYFLYIGSPEPHKNVGVLVDALGIAAELPERLVVAGTWYPEHLRQLTERAARYPGLVRRIHYRGFVKDPDLPLLIGQATAVIVPSLYEGFGLPVVEGFANNAVVIHSAIPVLEEASAGAALTFDPTSAVDLASCLRAVSGHPEERDRLRELGRRRVASITWDRAVTATVEAYRVALADAEAAR